jgi:hypothetical protein
MLMEFNLNYFLCPRCKQVWAIAKDGFNCCQQTTIIWIKGVNGEASEVIARSE